MLCKLKGAGLNGFELLSVYKSYIRPVLEYAVPLWLAGLTQRQSNQIEMIQKRVCRYILGTHHTTYNESLAKLDLEPLHVIKARESLQSFLNKSLLLTAVL